MINTISKRKMLALSFFNSLEKNLTKLKSFYYVAYVDIWEPIVLQKEVATYHSILAW